MAITNPLPKLKDIFVDTKDKISNANAKVKTALSNLNAAFVEKKAAENNSDNTLVTSAGTVGNTVPTYQEFFNNYYNKVVTNAENTYNQQIADAEIQRQKEVIAAANAYNSSTAQSGANAAALSSMGLAGSGYSKYLDSQAYAQKQGAVNLAYQNKQSAVNNAQTIKNTALQNADAMYLSYLEQLENNKLVGYDKIDSNLSTLSFGDIDRLGAQYGLDQTTIDSLKTAKNELTYASLLGSDYYKSDLDNLKELGQLDQTTYDKLLDNIKKISADEITFEKDGIPMTYSQALNELTAIKNSGAASEETIKALEEKFNTEYKAVTANVTFKKDSGVKGAFKDRAGVEGNNIKLEGSDGTVYKVQYNGAKLDDANNVAKNLPANTVFMYNGVIYVKHSDGKCYGIEAKPSNEKSYSALIELFRKASDDTSKTDDTVNGRGAEVFSIPAFTSIPIR